MARGALLGFAFLLPVCVVCLVYLYPVTLPFWDQWDVVFDILHRIARDEPWFWVAADQVNDSRRLLPHLIFGGLFQIQGYWDLRLELLFSATLCVSILVALYWLLTRTFGAKSLYAAMAAAVFSLMTWSHITLPFHSFSLLVDRLLPEAMLVLGLCLCVLRPRGAVLAVGLALGGWLAMFSFSAGLVVPFLLFPAFIMALRETRGRTIVPVFLYGLLVLLGFFLYFIGYEFRSSAASLLPSITTQPAEVVQFFLSVLGRTLARNTTPLMLAGALILIAFLLPFSFIVLRRRIGLLAMVWITLGLYGLAQAALATVIRFDYGMEESRRVGFVMYGAYVALAALALIGMQWQRKTRWRSSSALVFVIVLFIAADLVGRPALALYPVERAKQMDYARACLELASLMKNYRCAVPIHPNPKTPVTNYEKGFRAGVFQSGPLKVFAEGPPLKGHWCLSGPATIVGTVAIEEREPIAMVLTARADPDQILGTARLMKEGRFQLKAPTESSQPHAEDSWLVWAYDSSIQRLRPVRMRTGCAG